MVGTCGHTPKQSCELPPCSSPPFIQPPSNRLPLLSVRRLAAAAVVARAAPRSHAMPGRWSAALLVTALLGRLASGSPGDRAHVFQSCLAKCVKINCTQSEGEVRYRRVSSDAPGQWNWGGGDTDWLRLLILIGLIGLE